VYVYFNNDPGGAAVINSAQFATLARQAGSIATRTPEVGQVAATAALPTPGDAPTDEGAEQP
jgi:hypothetical protein